MKQPDHLEYYATRAAMSRDLAQRAASPSIAAIHTDLAKRYAMLAVQPQSDCSESDVQAA